MLNILAGLGALVNPTSAIASTLIGQIFGNQEEQQAPATYQQAPSVQYVPAPQPPAPEPPSALDFYFNGATQQYAGGGPVRLTDYIHQNIGQGGIMPAQGGGAPGQQSGTAFNFGTVNPAFQPLADDLNYWLGGGFTSNEAPGWDNAQKAKGYAEGGPVQSPDIPDEDLIQEAMQAVAGTYQGDANAVIAEFVGRFGDQALADLASRARKVAAKPELLNSDGKSDSIPAVINGVQPARLSEGEYIVPADVVSGLGKGSTDAGVRRLQEMADKVRAVMAAKDKK